MLIGHRLLVLSAAHQNIVTKGCTELLSLTWCEKCYLVGRTTTMLVELSPCWEKCHNICKNIIVLVDMSFEAANSTGCHFSSSP